MANAVEILITAKDQASNVIKDMAGDAKKNINSMSEGVKDGLNRTSLVMAGVAAGLTIYAKKATDHLVDQVSAAKALARQTGDTVENASRLNFALQRMGIDAGSASTVFNSLSTRIKEANEESGEAALKQAALRNKIESTKIEIARLTKEQTENGDSTGALRNKVEGLKLAVQGYEKQLQESSNSLTKLDIKTRNADGTARSFNAILLDVADRFKAMPDGVDKTNIALELFGRQGGNMVKVLNKGSEGIQEMMQQADKLGLTITSKNIAAVDAYIKSQKELKETTDGFKMAVATLTTPVMTKYNEVLNEMLQKVMGANAPTKELSANIVAFGGPVAGAISAVTGFAANIAGALPLLEKFGMFGRAAGGATEAGMGGAAAGAARLLPMLGWVGLAIAAVAAAAVAAAVTFKVSWQDVVNFFTVTVPAAFVTARDLAVVALASLRDNFFEYLGQVIGFMLTWRIKLAAIVIGAVVDMVKAIISVPWSDVFSGIWQGAQRAWDAVTNAAVRAWHFMHDLAWSDIFTAVGKGVGNSILGLIEGALKGALSGLPGNPGGKIKLPRFAQGGVFTRPTVGVFGEAGPEAIIPLNRPQRAQQVLQEAGLATGSQTTVHYHAPIYLQTVDAVREFFRLQDTNSSLAAAGLSVVRP